ncbi:unnamed protein product [Rodentolepis nana]|uniref:Transcriptional regulator n=1 Tax=Rodentolepis nana TaxID=102285 RepID=A0A0R3TQE5_RODNA|nr:unnamed protein product [Rodentolepis nana]
MMIADSLSKPILISAEKLVIIPRHLHKKFHPCRNSG